MKELYTAPNAELLRLAAEERLAADIELDITNKGVQISQTDIDVDII